MRLFILLYLYLITMQAEAKYMADGCPSDQIRMYDPNYGFDRCVNMNYINQGNPNCLTCNYRYYPNNYPFNYNYNPFMYQMMNQPWWANYGYLNYNNFNYPGHWNRDGVWGPSYPGNGDIVAMKPNIYFSSQKPQKLKLALEFSSSSTPLVATPALEKYWEVSVDNNNLQIGQANYPYVFYDFRTDKKHMQFEKGYCAAYVDVVDSMVKILEQEHYQSHEIKDFKEHWQLKIPKYDYYCVYPQDRTQLDQVAQIKLENDAKIHLKRLLFVLTPYRDFPLKAIHHRAQLPRQAWVVNRTPAAEDTLKVHEWGVAFWTAEVNKNHQ